ncbi:transglutaminase-like domain-containing protein [Flavobacterium sp. RHBU_3]|uniref:transglutaminase-like domain-containing protein n=1 Tax=Flavobacterium sp. RHBU_3 TaxID=3391184 RepID=UPI003984B512
MKRFLLPALLVATVATAQKNIDPTPEDITLAKELHTKYDKDDVALISSKESVSFDTNKDKVTVNYSVQEKLMNIGSRADIRKYEFYDSQSAIQTFSLKYRNDRMAPFAIKDEFYTSEDLFYNDARVKYATIDFPVQGYTYNYQLDKRYDDVKYFTALYFQDEYPNLKKEITVTVPEWLELEIREFNFAGNDIKKTVTKNGGSTTYSYVLENAPARVDESHMPGPSYLYPHLVFVAHSFTKGGPKKTLFNNTADLYSWYHSLVSSIEENPAVLKDKVKELTAKGTTDEQKIKNIYYWVQDNIRYIAFEDGIAGFKPESAANVFTKRYGDCKGMANLICRMLREAGYDARLTWIGTRHIAYDYTLPSLCVDNHMICTLIKGGKKIYLDGTEKYNSFGEYAGRIQGKEVMIEDGDKYIIEKVPVVAPAANLETYNAMLKVDGEQLVGKISGTQKGENRAAFLYGYNHIKNDKKDNALQRYLSGDDKNFGISNIVTSDLSNRDITLTLSYDAALKNRVSSFDNEMYIDLDLEEEYSGLDFKERKTDYEFGYRQEYLSEVVLDIPAGYKVTHLPEPLVADAPQYSFNVSYEQKGTTIIYKKHFVIKSEVIKKSDFAQWNQTIGKLKALYNDQITLTK